MTRTRTPIPIDHVDYCTRCGVEMLDIDVGFCLTLQGMCHMCPDGRTGDITWRAGTEEG